MSEVENFLRKNDQNLMPVFPRFVWLYRVFGRFSTRAQYKNTRGNILGPAIFLLTQVFCKPHLTIPCFSKVAASGVQRWRATIHYGGKSHHIGTFGTKEEAALAYDRAAREHGGRRNLNYVGIETAEAAGAAEAKAERPLVQGRGFLARLKGRITSLVAEK
jgi:hypothetical protein